MLTLAASSHMEIEIKRSRFVARAGRVDNLAETLEFYESVIDPQATHNCWAWRLDHQYRFNDDGEPASTAGKPILSAIEGKGLDHVMIVVTRYFGGIKLGVGGLVRAYGGSASKCIDQARIVDIQPRIECLVQAGFPSTGQVYAALDAFEAKRISEQHQEDGIHIRIEIEKSRLEQLKTRLTDMTRGEATIRPAV
ncbi:IMPACT family protein [Pseudomonadota bacterium]